MRDADRGEDLQVRAPLDGGAGAVAIGGLDLERLLLGAHDLALLEVEGVLVAVAPDRDVHVLGGVLGRAGAQAVGTEREVVVAALVVVVLSAGVELAEDELPVKALLGRVPIERAAAAVVLDLDGAVAEGGEGDQVAVALARLVDRVGQDLECGVRAAVEPVRAEDDGGAQAYALLVLELTDAVVAIVCGVLCHARSLGGSSLGFCSHVDEYRSIARPVRGPVQAKSIERMFVSYGCSFELPLPRTSFMSMLRACSRRYSFRCDAYCFCFAKVYNVIHSKTKE